MKILTLWEPWATLMAIGAKRIETRGWYTSYRGPLAIHAAKTGLPKQQLMDCLADPVFSAALDGVEMKPGHIVAVVDVLDCCHTQQKGGHRLGVFRDYPELDTPKERAFGDYAPGRRAWVTENLFRLPEPIPYKGGQGLTELDWRIVQQIKAQGWRGA